MLRPLARIFALTVALWLAACGNSPHPPPDRTTREDGKPWAIRYAWSPSEPKSLDPQNAYDQASRIVMEPVFDTLLEYHPHKTDPFELMPGMLEDFPTRENLPDGKIAVTCRLKKGITFHDAPCFPNGTGREVIAQDVYYAWQRMSDPSVECPIVSTLGEYVDGLMDNFNAAKANGDKLDYEKPFRGVQVVDRYTFKIILTKPFPQLQYWMGMHFLSPVSREAIEYYDQKKFGGDRLDAKFRPVGHGAFVFSDDSYKHGQSIRLTRNPKYRTLTFPGDAIPPEREAVCRPLAGHALPFIDEVQFLFITEMLPVWLLTKQGYLDRYSVQKDAFNAVVTQTYGLSPELAARGMILEKATEVSSFYTLINMRHPLLGTNKKLRQALACAYDASRFSMMFYDGVRPVCQQLIPPGLFGYRKDYQNPYGYDFERAKRLLAEAGYPGGKDASGKQLEITLDFNADNSTLRRHAEFERDSYEALGIKVKVNENTFSRLLEKQETGNFQLASGSGWGADYPDPENFLMLFYSKNMPPTGKNEVGFQNEEYDRLYEKMAAMENTPERLAVVHRMSDILSEECPIILNTQKAYFILVQPWAPLTHDNVMLEGGLKYLPLDPLMRAEKQKEWNRPRLWPIGLLAGFVGFGAVYAIQRSRKSNV